MAWDFWKNRRQVPRLKKEAPIKIEIEGSAVQICSKCGNPVIIGIVNPGDMVTCRECGTEFTVL